MTEEQQLVVDTVCSSTDGIITVNAVAGAGKTTTAVNITKAVKPKSGFYTAFNKGIVKDSATKFGDLLEAKTIHSLAYKHIKPSKIEDFSYDKITEDIDYPDKRKIINYLDGFYRSSALDFEEYFRDKDLDSNIEDLIMKYANKMYAGKIPSTFNYLLKCLHLMLVEGSIKPEFDLFIFDEFQDVIPVSLEIFKLIECPKKVALGDRHQNIYSFLNTVNGFELLDNTTQLFLTKSFRCNPTVAKEVEAFGKQNFGDYFKFKGNEELGNLPDTDDKVYLSKDNSSIILRMNDLLDRGKSFSLIRTLDEIFELPFAIVLVASGKPVYSSKYKFLESEKKIWTIKQSGLSFFQHLESLNVEELTSAIRTLRDLKNKNINIFDLKTKLKKVKPSKNIVLSTAHAYKGLEKSIAILEPNLNKMITNPSSDELVRQENNNLYYVALSRAKHSIIKL